MIGAAVLALALQAGPGAVPPSSDPTIMIVEFPRGAPVIGLPARCPGSTEEVPPEDEICLAELYQGPAVLIRHLSGPRVGRRSVVRLTAHARRWREGTRMLVVTRPFEDRVTSGNFALWWRLPEENGDYCMVAEDIARDGDNVVTRQFAAGYRQRFRGRGSRDPADFHCLRGQAIVIRDL